MVHPINQLGFTPNGNVYRKSNSNEKRGMAILGALSAAGAGRDIYNSAKELHRFKCPLILPRSSAEAIKNAAGNCSKVTLGDKKAALAYAIAAGILSVGVNAFFGKVIGSTIDSIVNDRRSMDADGAEVFLLRQQAKDIENTQDAEEVKEAEEPAFEAEETESVEQDFAADVEDGSDIEEADFEPEFTDARDIIDNEF